MEYSVELGRFDRLVDVEAFLRTFRITNTSNGLSNRRAKRMELLHRFRKNVVIPLLKPDEIEDESDTGYWFDKTVNVNKPLSEVLTLARRHAVNPHAVDEFVRKTFNIEICETN